MTVDNLESGSRISSNLPEVPVEIPASILEAHRRGTIKGSDVVYGLVAHIIATHKPDVEPPLSVTEESNRWRAINQIAVMSAESQLEQ